MRFSTFVAAAVVVGSTSVLAQRYEESDSLFARDVDLEVEAREEAIHNYVRRLEPDLKARGLDTEDVVYVVRELSEIIAARRAIFDNESPRLARRGGGKGGKGNGKAKTQKVKKQSKGNSSNKGPSEKRLKALESELGRLEQANKADAAAPAAGGSGNGGKGKDTAQPQSQKQLDREKKLKAMELELHELEKADARDAAATGKSGKGTGEGQAQKEQDVEKRIKALEDEAHRLEQADARDAAAMAQKQSVSQRDMEGVILDARDLFDLNEELAARARMTKRSAALWYSRR